MSVEICSKVLAVELARTPRAALPRLTPPGSKDSKGNWALMGVRGVFQYLASYGLSDDALKKTRPAIKTISPIIPIGKLITAWRPRPGLGSVFRASDVILKFINAKMMTTNPMLIKMMPGNFELLESAAETCVGSFSLNTLRLLPHF